MLAGLNSKRLREDDFYDVIVFGYINAVRRYHSDHSLRQYTFSTIAWRGMQSSLSNHYKSESRQKRKGHTISLDALTYDGESCISIHEAVSTPDSLMEELEAELIMQALAVKLPTRQMNVLRMKAEGSGVREIAKEQSMTVKGVQEMLAGMKDAVLNVCFG